MSGGLLAKIRQVLRWRSVGGRTVDQVDAGRDSFLGTGRQEQRLKRELLKKLNSYRVRKQLAIQTGYSPGTAKPVRLRAVALAVGLIAALGFFATGSGPGGLVGLLASVDFFRLTGIEVQGCRRIPVSQVRDATGAKVSDSLITLDCEAIAEAVEATSEWIKHVDVARKWPDTLVIRINEYDPYALLAKLGQGRSELYYLDHDGTPFIRVGAGMDLDYPVVTGLEGATDDQRREQLQEPLSFLHLLDANNPNLPVQSISEIFVDGNEGLVVYLVEYPFPIFLGNGEIRQKYLRLRKVLEVLYKPRKTGMDIARVAYIRMNYLQDKVIVGYKES